MPYLQFNTSKTLTAEQREAVKTELGKLIAIIPTKTEKNFMIDFCEGHPMYFHGQPARSCAFLELRLFGKSDFQAKQQFVQQVFRMMDHVLGIKEDEMFMNIIELEEWGSRGNLNARN